MILFPGCKINLGLRVLRKRPDGYHDIESVMVPAGWSDILEILPPTTREVKLITLGRTVNCPPEMNLVVKAWKAMHERYQIGAVDIVLEKIVPDGAGLGGGSADVAATLAGLNSFFALGLFNSELADIASTIGADCPFFIYNKPMLATGTGTTLKPHPVPEIRNKFLLIVKPESVSISTAHAYAGIVPHKCGVSVTDIISRPIDEWQGLLVNDFEQSIFPIAPEVAHIKQKLIDEGALYASMSGSGSAVFGIFDLEEVAKYAATTMAEYPTYICRMES